MDHFSPSGLYRPDLFAKAGEVGGEDGGGDHQLFHRHHTQAAARRAGFFMFAGASASRSIIFNCGDVPSLHGLPAVGKPAVALRQSA
jgi:hypothetical protein